MLEVLDRREPASAGKSPRDRVGGIADDPDGPIVSHLDQNAALTVQWQQTVRFVATVTASLALSVYEK